VRIVLVNLAYDTTITEPSSLLDRYHSLTGMGQALSAAGAHVSVVQRFSREGTCDRDGVRYHFIVDSSPAALQPSASSSETAAVVRAADPDVVHINGLMFPAVVSALRDTLPRARIVVQDHSGMAAPKLLDRLLHSSWHGLRQADAYSFTAAAHAAEWRARGLLKDDAPVFEIVEASTTLSPSGRQAARERAQLTGDPLILWVGRLNENKDPLTVVRGLGDAFHAMRDARACMVYSNGTLEGQVRRAAGVAPDLRERITFVGRVPYERMSLYYSAADFFVSGSRQEGSGYALIEAMACGVVPVVTDIPPFRVIAGDCGVRWTAGNSASLRDALVDAARFDRVNESARVRERFLHELTWDAIAKKTLAAYRTLRG
jgi:glycosyltransferase involved in cell wall biosynthesis